MFSPKQAASVAVLLSLSALPALCGITCNPPPSQWRHGLYLSRGLVASGQSADVRVSSAVPTADVFIQNDVTGVEVYRATIDTSAQQTGFLPHLDPGWTRGHTLPALPAGLYRVGVDQNIMDPDQREVEFNDQRTYESELLVRPTSPQGTILLVYDQDTQNAYNEWGGRGFYTTPANFTIGERRPGFWRAIYDAVVRAAKTANTLGISWDVADQRWVEQHPGDLTAYRAVVMVQQMEYLSRDFRDAITAYVDGGGRLAAFGNELMLYQTRRDGDFLTCYKSPYRGTDPILNDGDPSNDHLATYQWAFVGPPETTLFGTSTWLGHQLQLTGESWRVARGGHWLFAGSGLGDGDTFQPMPDTQIVDGTDILWDTGYPYVTNLAATGTPANTLVLATVPTTTAVSFDCHMPPPVGQGGWTACFRPGHGTIVIRETVGGGVVLTVPDRRWWGSFTTIPEIETITENVFSTFASPAAIDVYDGYATAP